MTFDSPAFLFGFLPVVLLLVLVLQRAGRLRLAMFILIIASLVFYSWWKPIYLLVLLGSVFFNYLFGLLLIRYRSKALLAMGIAGNVLLLGYFKYLGFLIETLRTFGTPLHPVAIILPLGISFFMFTQIAYLIDVYRGATRERNVLHYLLFVTFFPNLLAGPIAHHANLSPQLKNPPRKIISRNLAVGLTVLSIGLFKKVILADSVGAYANLIFNATASGTSPLFADAWIGAIAYSFQLYFDFSGYTDMAIGIAQMMGVRLPLNFNAPYRSGSIREFWRRWHITLSRFLMENLYIPLGGSRRGEVRTLLNLFLTMLIAGVWHGAGWTFIVWGAWHGIWLALHRVWLKAAVFRWLRPVASVVRLFAVPLTFLMLTIGWVFFRAADLSTALSLLTSMTGLHGFTFSTETSLLATAFAWKRCLQLLAILSFIIWFAPTTQAFVTDLLPDPKSEDKRDPFVPAIRWKPNVLYALFSTTIAMAAVTTLFLAQEHVFIYFQF